MLKRRFSKWYTLFACIIISVATIYLSESENEENRVVTAMFIELEDETKEPVYYKQIKGESTELNLTLQYSSNKEQKVQVYLLHNFSLTPFSINGNESIRHTLNIEPLEYLKSSKDNVLTLKDIIYEKNEFCLIIIGETHIATKRFQLDNISSDESHEEIEINELACSKLIEDDLVELPIFTTNKNPHIKESKESIKWNVDKNMYVVCNYNRLIGKNVKNQQELEYIVLPMFMKEELYVGSPLSIQTKETSFFFNIKSLLKEEQDNLRIMMFPYPYKFTEDFLGSFEAEIWSNLLITREIRKDV